MSHRAPVDAEATRARRWRATSLLLAVLLLVSLAGLVAQANEAPSTSGAAAAVQAATDPQAQLETEQLKSENLLLRQVLVNADATVAHHRHHSELMWDLLAGRITVREAWWQGGESTCAGWLTANAYEVAKGRLEGREVTPPPLPEEAKKFCKLARERR